MSGASNPGAEALTESIRAANRKSGMALAPFLTAGFPDKASFVELFTRVAGQADLIEIGVPFSDPMADGVTIQHSSQAALREGVTLSWILEMLGGTQTSCPRVLMSYLNPLLSFGLDRLARESQAAGVHGWIVPDLPFEECRPIRDALDSAGVALIQLVSPVTPESRLSQLCLESRGFVYAVTQTGTTGGNLDRLSEGLEYLDRVRRWSPVPVLAGFGIREAAQLDQLQGHADGAIVGSALIEVIARGADPVKFLKSLRPAHGPAKEDRR